MTRQYISNFKHKMSSLEFILKKIDDTRIHLLNKIKHKDLMRKSIKRHVSI